MKCPSCQAPIRPEDTFCGSCGYRLTQEDRANSSPVSSPEPPSSFPPMPGPPPIQIQLPSSPVQQVRVVQPAYDQAPQPAAPQSYGQGPQPNYGQMPQPVRSQTYQPAKKKSNGCIIALIVAVVLGLCAVVVIAGIYFIPKILPTATPTAVSSYQPPVDGGSSLSGGEADLLVVNNLSVAVCFLYVSPSNSDNWGADWLVDLGWIDPGDSATFSIVADQTVDMRVEDCDGTMLDEQYGVYVDSSGITYTLNP